MAIEFYKKATVTQNYAAEIDYIDCMIKCNKYSSGKFNIVQQLKSILQKYKNFKDFERDILLHLGMQYNYRGNLIEAAKNFLEAIELDPENKQLKVSFIKIHIS